MTVAVLPLAMVSDLAALLLDVIILVSSARAEGAGAGAASPISLLSDEEFVCCSSSCSSCSSSVLLSRLDRRRSGQDDDRGREDPARALEGLLLRLDDGMVMVRGGPPTAAVPGSLGGGAIT